jgi:osmotically-inducible protein OsmY
VSTVNQWTQLASLSIRALCADKFALTIFLVVSMLAVAGVLSSDFVHAQDTSQPFPTTKRAIRSANWNLEHAVRIELQKEKVDTSDMRIRANQGAVALIGTVKDEGQITLAGVTAQGVLGVKGLENDVTVRTIGQ